MPCWPPTRRQSPDSSRVSRRYGLSPTLRSQPAVVGWIRNSVRSISSSNSNWPESPRSFSIKTLMTALQAQLEAILPTAMSGSITRTEGLACAVAGLPAPVGAVVEIERMAQGGVEAEVIGFRGRETIVYPFGEMTGVRRGDRVRLRRTRRTLRI